MNASAETNGQTLHHSNNAGGIQMEERKEPTFMQWDREGKNVTGRLTRIDEIEVGEQTQQAARYVIEERVIRGGAFVPSGEHVAFLGTHVLDTKLRASDIAITSKCGTSAKAERIPHIKLGKYLRFETTAVRTWLNGLRNN